MPIFLTFILGRLSCCSARGEITIPVQSLRPFGEPAWSILCLEIGVGSGRERGFVVQAIRVVVSRAAGSAQPWPATLSITAPSPFSIAEIGRWRKATFSRTVHRVSRSAANERRSGKLRSYLQRLISVLERNFEEALHSLDFDARELR